MALTGKRVTATTTATRLDTADTDTVAGKSVALKNAGAASVDLGASTVTSGAGYELAAGAAVSIDLGAGESVYAITASGTAVVHVIETGV